MRKLPEIDGYTVDERLREFRKVDMSKPSIEFVKFDSPKGEKLLEKYEREKMKEKLSPAVCKTISEYIDDEEKGQAEYNDLKTQMPCPIAASLIQTMATDENKHKRALRELYSELC